MFGNNSQSGGNVRRGIVSGLFSTFVISLLIGVVVGFMISMTGLAIYPQINLIAAPLICSTKPEIVMEQYSNHEESGASLQYFCPQPNGKLLDVTNLIMLLSVLSYTGIAAVAVFVLRITRNGARRNKT